MKGPRKAMLICVLGCVVASSHAQNKPSAVGEQPLKLKPLRTPVEICSQEQENVMEQSSPAKPPDFLRGQSCRKAMAPKCVNLCDLAVGMLPAAQPARQRTFWKRQKMTKISTPDHEDVVLSVGAGQEIVWYCKFSKLRQGAQLPAAKFNYQPGTSRSFAIIDIKEVQTQECDERVFAKDENPFCAPFLNRPQTGELHAGVPADWAIGHTFKYTFVIGPGPGTETWIPRSTDREASFGIHGVRVDPHLIVTGGGVEPPADLSRKKGGKCSSTDGANQNKKNQ